MAFTQKVRYAVDYYNRNISEQSEIYNGTEYNFLPRATKGSPYLEDRFEFTNANIKYNDTWYNDVSILYDAFKDVLVATQPVNQAQYILHKEYLAEFYLFGHHFVHLNAMSSDNASINDGYYDQLYAGKTVVICKYSKIKTETVTAQGIEVVFDDKQSFFIKKGATIYSVNSKGSVLNAFKDKKKELNTYLSRNNIDYKNNKGLAIARLAAYYDQISK
ncbi:hypothetical protein GCM10011425_22020 [Mucilaginibacter galii]|uniref:Uncharacterized protein n=2 Tax=Mucilaginibacter galii TaxID=2005073 RepID=A0A917N1J5_9SPHI|nr:hypothetical protein GCM10011425_22020 [Mucilaginibacter galii]